MMLEQQVHQALKDWHDESVQKSPLAELFLYQNLCRTEKGSSRQKTNQLLLSALDVLNLQNKIQADILRLHFLDGTKMHLLANQLNIGEATIYRRQKEAVAQLTAIIETQEETLRKTRASQLESRLETPTYLHLVGAETALNQLWSVLTVTEPPWIISIEGLGGLGKTTIADALARKAIAAYTFADMAWLSARQVDLLPSMQITKRDLPALDLSGLINGLLRQLRPSDSLNQPLEQKKASLKALLKRFPHLIFIDNLETTTDHLSLLPLLRELVKPSKVVLTSRTSLRLQPDIFCLGISSLSQAESIQLLRLEAHFKGLTRLESASDEELTQIWQVVGGNPLALKLVLGQLSFWPLEQVLADLKMARGDKNDTFYTYIYRQAWDKLNDACRQVLLVMPLVYRGSLDQLLAVSQLDPRHLQDALEQLITLSLVYRTNNLNQPRYHIHRLTETFLLNEAIKWQSET